VKRHKGEEARHDTDCMWNCGEGADLPAVHWKDALRGTWVEFGDGVRLAQY
jgi:hypothetical protein